MCTQDTCPNRFNKFEVNSHGDKSTTSADLGELRQMETHEGKIRLSKSAGSLTVVERACDESEQVLCELEDLPLAPFPAAHLCSLTRGARER